MDIKTIGKVARNSFIIDTLNSIGIQTDLNKDKIKELEEWSIFSKMNETAVLLWENFLDLKPQLEWSLEDKRERIIYTLNSTKTFTPQFLKEQSLRFSNGEIDIEELFELFHFKIQFTSSIGVPSNLDNFVEMIEVNKPAHLTFEYLLRYRTHTELEPYTHLFLESNTHEFLREGGII